MAWATVRIGDLGRVVTGKTPPSSQPEMFEGDVPFFTPSDMEYDKRDIEPERHVSAGWDPRGRGLLPARSVCVVCIGATIGKVCMTSRASHSNQQVNSVVVDEERFDPGFVYYSLRMAGDELKSKAAGAATPIINKSSFSDVTIRAPSLETQQRIAAILGAYDDLIKVNRRRVALLEEMARGLFEEWFVRFRFPGHEDIPIVDTPDGPLAQGWEFQRVEDAFAFLGGGTPSKKIEEYWTEGTVDWFTPSDLTGSGSLFMDRSGLRIAEAGLAKSSAKLFPADSIMMTSRATLGVISICTGPASTNQGFITCLPNERLPRTYLYHWLRQNVPVFIAHATGATFKEITKGVFKKLKITVPSQEVVEHYEKVARPMHEMVLALERSNRSLAASRDLLLPRLISGQLSVEAAERQMEDAA